MLVNGCLIALLASLSSCPRYTEKQSRSKFSYQYSAVHLGHFSEITSPTSKVKLYILQIVNGTVGQGLSARDKWYSIRGTRLITGHIALWVEMAHEAEGGHQDSDVILIRSLM